MISAEENALLTCTDPGTACGTLLRRYWQPVALSSELSPGGAPLPVRILGEDLVLFRDDQGRPGLLGVHCCHRGADLSYGRVEDGGLRCIYHGWLYDVDGNCLDQPGEPEGGRERSSFHQPAYPCREQVGVIFAYLGGGEPPLLRNFEFLSAPADHVFVSKIHHGCNYLQANEGNIDPVHLSFLHRNLEESESDKARVVKGGDSSPNSLIGRNLAPTIDVELTDFGVRIYTTRGLDEAKQYLRVSYFILPNLSAFPGQTGEHGCTINWHVPIDDTHHWKFVFVFDRDNTINAALAKQDRSDMTEDYRLIRNQANRYLQDRDSMRDQSFSGIGHHFQAQDLCVTEGEGPVQDRTQEHVVTSDRAILAARKLILRSIKDVQDGGEAPSVKRDPESNHFPELAVLSEVVDISVPVREHTKNRIAELS